MPNPSPWATEARAKLAHFCSQFLGWWKKHDTEIWLAVVFAIVVAVGVEVGKEGWVGPAEYKVYLIGDLKNSDITDIFHAFQTAYLSEPPQYIDGVPIKIEFLDDDGRVDKATDIARESARDKSTLLVVGNIYSSLTKKTLPVYMAADPRIPLIAATETDDALNAGCVAECLKGFAPVLQMAPTNEAQAESAVRYAITRRRSRCWIVYDNNAPNTDYANNLRDDFKRAINRHSWEGLQLISQPWNIDSGVMLHDSDIENYHPDCIFFAGPLESAKLLISSLDSVAHGRDIVIFLPDTAVSSNLLRDQLLSKHKNLLFTYPTDATYFGTNQNTFGADSAAVTRQLITGADTSSPTLLESIHQILGMHRVSDARAQIIRGMQARAESGASYVGTGNSLDNPTTYKFWGFKRDDASFHVWKVANNQVVDVDSWHPHSEKPAGNASKGNVELVPSHPVLDRVPATALLSVLQLAVALH